MKSVGDPIGRCRCALFSVLIARQRSLAGSSWRIKEAELLDYCAAHKITSDVEVIPIHQINDAYERVIKGQVKYRFVIDIASLK